MTRLFLTLIAGLAGVALTVGGLAWDAWLHAQDQSLAAREGIFTLSNPGHLLLALGMTLTCASIFGAIYTVWGMTAPSGLLGRPWVRIASLHAATLTSIAAVLFALAASAESHAHGDAATADHDHADPAAHAPAASSGATLAQPHMDGLPAGNTAAPLPHAHLDATAPALSPAEARPDEHHATDLPDTAAQPAPDPLSPRDPSGDAEHAAAHDHAGDGASKHPRNHPRPTAGELSCLADLTAQAKEATARLASFATAAAEGYRPPRRAGGTHYGNPAYHRDGAIFDLARPESAIYRTLADGTHILVGALYVAPVGQGPTPCGNATWWHTHPVCIDLETRETSDAGPDGTCPDGLAYREPRNEMLHLWFVPRSERR